MLQYEAEIQRAVAYASAYAFQSDSLRVVVASSDAEAVPELVRSLFAGSTAQAVYDPALAFVFIVNESSQVGE